MTTPEPRLTTAAGHCLLAALTARTRWDEPPDLATLTYARELGINDGTLRELGQRGPGGRQLDAGRARPA